MLQIFASATKIFAHLEKFLDFCNKFQYNMSFSGEIKMVSIPSFVAGLSIGIPLGIALFIVLAHVIYKD